ncbi:leucoanthocyanidin dioxygenase-like protein, putative, partial [Medicago truncatula]
LKQMESTRAMCAVTNPDRARLSMATFHDPAKTVKISPVSELINDSSPAKR